MQRTTIFTEVCTEMFNNLPEKDVKLFKYSILTIKN